MCVVLHFTVGRRCCFKKALSISQNLLVCYDIYHLIVMLRSLLNVIPVVSVATCQSASEFVNSSDLKNTSFNVERILLNKEYKENKGDETMNNPNPVRLKKR